MSLPSGEYPTPNVRQSVIKVPLVAGYTTGRLRGNMSAPVAASNLGYGTVEVNASADIANTGTVVLNVVQATDVSSSGARTTVASAISIVRGGNVTFSFNASQRYLEIQGVSGAGNVSLQISSQIKYDQVGFLRTETIYPTSLWAATYTTPTSPVTTNVSLFAD